MSDNDDKLLDGVQGIAEHFLPATDKDSLKRNARTVQHWIDAHGMPVVRNGRRIYGRPASIREWLSRREAGNDLAAGDGADELGVEI